MQQVIGELGIGPDRRTVQFLVVQGVGAVERPIGRVFGLVDGLWAPSPWRQRALATAAEVRGGRGTGRRKAWHRTAARRACPRHQGGELGHGSRKTEESPYGACRDRGLVRN
eukprot:CAMPEP_0177330002 /NCGR_PEP_ID=MMETSP0368-20130122/20287_1 /TAXON_ID=447022 ORGANISM="Scrippsiella hangoei-like, Strain SHHI-4" /NCGR_SAMPLE_ID=MMETSP0368 /ASSEMBLY_ACC=CAM_ASM_000363 /LENGTH=111 /DNA_ID=CAMNT_0018790293 /DNA_START=185 /DNA_END=517 /DNA_ORIENTATION=-